MRPGRPTATVGSRLFRAVPGEVFRRRSPGWLRTCYWSSASTRDVGRRGWRGGAATPFEPPAFRSDCGASDRGGFSRCPNRRERTRRGIFLENCPTAEAWPNCWEDTMAGLNKKLVAALEACFADLRGHAVYR